MPSRSSTRITCLRWWMAVTLGVTSAWAQDPPASKDDPARGAASEAYDAGTMVEAMPQFEALAAKYPTDIVIRERWAFSALFYAATLNNPEQRKKARVRARAVALEAQKLGDNSQLWMSALEVPEDGSEGIFSKTPEVDAAMRSAEANFARGEYDKRRDGLHPGTVAGAHQLRRRTIYWRRLFQAARPGQCGRVV